MDYTRPNKFFLQRIEAYSKQDLINMAKELNLDTSGGVTQLYNRITDYYNRSIYDEFLKDDFDSIYNTCYKYRSLYDQGLCDDEGLWENKTIKDYGNRKIKDTWCETYQSLYEQDKNVFFMDEAKYTTIDVFDFPRYKKEYQAFSHYFADVELYLRLAIFLDYKYNYLRTMEERYTLDQSLSNKKALIDITDIFDTPKLLLLWYLHFNPEMANEETVNEVLDKYESHEDVLFNRLYKKYVNPNYSGNKPLWFSN